ncbi:hypothetical protein ACKWTF_008147 [Chironomus riparius]
MDLKIISVFLITLFLCGFAEKARFDHYRVYEVSINNDEQLSLMREIESYSDSYQFIEKPGTINSNTRLIVPPHKFAEFEEIVVRYEIKSRLLINNFQEIIDNEQPKGMKKGIFDWTRYWELNEIYEWFNILVTQFPNDVSIVNIGDSYEGRPILGLKLNIGGGANKKSIIFEGTHHAREWISAATVTYMLNELLTSNNTDVKDIAAAYEWYIFPVTNPDGYLYTWTNNRMWRKNRKPTSNLLCIGTDLNRNWDNFFNQGGTSFNPCDNTYAGSSPFSEPETKVLSEFIKTVPNLVGYFPFHSYSQILMVPYGWTHELLDNYHELYAIGEKALETLSSFYGTTYELGSIANVIYIATGASIDWVKYELKTNVTFEYEMRDVGAYGFNLPASQIIENSIEVFASIITILQEAQKIGIA